MSQIQSSVGLITGLPILDTVDKIIAVSARPRNRLQERNAELESQQVALAQLSSLLLGVRFEIGKLKSAGPFESRRVISSDTAALTASRSAGSTPIAGKYNFTPVQTASAHQLLSSPLGPGAPPAGLRGFSLQFGGLLDSGAPLARLNEGRGVSPGKLRITDRGGASGVIDLRFARSVDDVLNAINSAEDVNVTAVTSGDRIRLLDNTGQSASNLVVQEVDGGSTAADLGLAGIDVADSVATGQDVLQLHRNTRLDALNDGLGVVLHDGTDDLEVQLQDGTLLHIDLGAADTLGDVLDGLNAADPGRFQAALSPDGDRLVLSDLTSGGETFSVSSVVGSTAAEELGLVSPASGGSITGRRLQAGLKTTLLQSLNGGQGLGQLGTVQLTDRAGNVGAVDLAPAETVDDVIAAINGAGVGIQASIHSARNGIVLEDTTGAAASHLVITSSDATESAEKLGIVVDADVKTVESGSLDRQTVGHATPLENFAGGVASGSFVIRDSSGNEGAVRLGNPAAPISTIGGVIDAINALEIDVEARINDRGDGILLVDRGDGSGQLAVREVGNGTAAANLRLTGTASEAEVDGESRQVIDGTTLETVDIASEISLSSLGTTGVELGRFTVRDSTGKTAIIDLAQKGAEAETIADVIDAINSAGLAVEARINDTGDGLLLVDHGGGAGSMTVTDDPGKTTAQDLRIAETGTSSEPSEQIIDGTGLFDSSRVDAAAMPRVVEKINNRQIGVSATTFSDGTSFRLSISVDRTGAGREVLIDSDDEGLQFAEVAPARDALVHFGIGTQGGILLASPTNEFKHVVDGVDLTVQAASIAPVAVTVTGTDEELLKAVEQFVAAYNSLRDNLSDLTSFDATDGSTGVLFGTHEALRADSDVSRLVTQRFRGLGQFESLQEIGIQLDDKGKLQLNRERLQEAFLEDPQSLERLFTDEGRGVAVQFEAAIDQLVGEESSLFASRSDSLKDETEINTHRIAQLNLRLENERERLLKQFFAMEEVVARMQSDLAAIQGIQALAPLSVSLGQSAGR